ncbi:MAG: beta-N-acetylhexosaminidase [Thiovulaceae bacterium]|nr:beta-N-acetylhexosaminidase [Sulfurimonadaceae bacterium]
MKLLAPIFASLFLLLAPVSAQTDVGVIIPKPNRVQRTQGEFVLTDKTHYTSQTPLSKNAIDYLQKQLAQNAGYTLSEAAYPEQNRLLFKYNAELGEEAYRLRITPEEITLEAKSEAGFFYAMMSLMQLFPPAIWGQERADTLKESWPVAACTIEDAPRFRWRGMMLDSSRNFFSKEYVKKFIDRLAQHKLNVFHWHLSDDEGWQIEIKKYPLLTQSGFERGSPKMRKPYYTQDDVKEIVAYANKRSVHILPEIDIPAHSQAAVMAYPELLQDPDDKSRYTSVQGYSNNTIDPGLESSYLFLEEVIKELTVLFPFEYFHLGGDEVPEGAWQRSPAVGLLMQKEHLKDSREVEAYFFNRMDRILAKYGRKMIAWQEVASYSSELRDGTIIMAWKGDHAGLEAAKSHRKVIMAPVQYLYFDQQYIKKKGEPGHTWAGAIDTKKAYAYRPERGFTAEEAGFVLGVHGCLWSETALSEEIADYLAWPRIFALAEIGWSDQKRRDWEDFKKRVFGAGFQRLDMQKINYRKPETP